ncbi:MAG: YdeI/OmpD-associated family protein [Paracoccaceae bacterium]|nr:YdeI/OmpD-associated family protein [Paracoccaceae bacterium]
MGAPDRRCDVLFDRFEIWRDEMAALRAILLESPLDEAFKWRAPVYTHQGGNVAILWALKEHCAVGFFKGVLLDDPASVLVAPGQNSRAARKAVFRSTEEIAAGESALRGLIVSAIAVEEARLNVEFAKDDLDTPAELAERLAADPDLAMAFDAPTPGRRRGYILNIASAKRPATRLTRVKKHAPRILAGKGLHDR